MIIKRRKLDCCYRLGSPRTVIVCAALLTVVVYSAMSMLRPEPPPAPEKPSLLRETLRNLSRFARIEAIPGGRARGQPVSASPQSKTKSALVFGKEARTGSNGSTSSVVNGGDRDSQALASILTTFQARVAIKNRRIVNPHRYKYIFNVPGACTGKTVEIMIGVPSRIDSFTQRETIRQTWGEYASEANNKAVLLFFLGSTPNRELQERVRAEVKTHGDVVQESFIDTYNNLSLKTVALVRWASHYCQDSTFVVKADDDMYINVPRLLAKLRSQLDKGPLFIIGFLHPDSRPFRTKGHKWYVPPSEFRHKKYPNYVSGTAYAMTTTAAMRLYVESFYVRLLYLEDVYLTGILADKASVPRVSESEFSAHKYDPTGCNFKYRISGHRNSPEDMRKIHAELFDPDLRCKV